MRQEEFEERIRIYKEKRIKFYLFIIIILLFDFLGEFYFWKLPINPALKNGLLNMWTFGVILLPMPILFLATLRQNLLFPLITITLIIFLTTYLVEEELLPFYFNGLYLLVFIVLMWIKKKNPEILKLLSLQHFNIKNVFIGIIAGVLVGTHLIFSASLSRQLTPQFFTKEEFFYVLFFVLGVNGISEEIFYRGFIFQQLQFFGWSFWASSLLAAFCCILRYLSNPLFYSIPLTIYGSIFYLLLSGIIFAALLKYTKSIIPSISANIIFSLFYYSLH